MKLFPKQLLIFSELATLLVTVVAVRVDQACYGNETAIDCSQHRLQCQQGSIFLTQAFRGFKPWTNACPVQGSTCQDRDNCCYCVGQDCVEPYSEYAFSVVAMECWSKESCIYTIPYAYRARCNSNNKDGSGYSDVQYLCLQDTAILDFIDTRTKTSSSLALRYLSSHIERDSVCLVEAEDCTIRAVDVLLYRTSTSSNTGKCTSLATSEGWLPCIANSGVYRREQYITPLVVWLDVNKKNDAVEAWVLIHGETDNSIRVTCKSWDESYSLSRCPPAGVSSHAVTGGALQSLDAPVNTTVLVGGVLGTVLLVLVVALVFIVVFITRRPTAKTSQQEEDDPDYATLSDLTRVQPRTEADYESLVHVSAFSRRPDMTQPEADNSAYSH